MYGFRSGRGRAASKTGITITTNTPNKQEKNMKKNTEFVKEQKMMWWKDSLFRESTFEFWERTKQTILVGKERSPAPV